MGWWNAAENGGIAGSNPTGRIWGDEAADIAGDAVAKIVRVFERAHGRKPTEAEMVAGLQFATKPHELELVSEVDTKDVTFANFHGVAHVIAAAVESARLDGWSVDQVQTKGEQVVMRLMRLTPGLYRPADLQFLNTVGAAGRHEDFVAVSTGRSEAQTFVDSIVALATEENIGRLVRAARRIRRAMFESELPGADLDHDEHDEQAKPTDIDADGVR